MSRNVKGILFADYVRMMRNHKAIDWEGELLPEDAQHLLTHVEMGKWYPMETFERMGNAILREIAHGDLDACRMWGYFSVDQLRAMFPDLVSAGDPIETLMRFRVLRSTFFDFEALEVPMLIRDHAQVVIGYHMGDPAEEAASIQTLGFFERLLQLAGATDVRATFLERVWAGDPRTLLELRWQTGP